MIRLILGRAGSGKTTKLLQTVRDRAEKGVRGQIFLVPEQFSLNAERALCRVCGNQISLSAEVFTFRSLATRVFDELGGGCAAMLDEGGRLLTMYLAVSNIRSQLRVYRDAALRPEFLKKLVALTEELKTYRVDPDDLRVLEGSGGSLPDKLHDIATISSTYDALMTAELKDPADRLQTLERVLDGSGYFRGRCVYIDGFNGFTAAELAVLEHIFTEADEVCLALCADGVRDEDLGTGLFSHVKQTIRAILAFCEKNGIDCVIDNNDLAPRRFANPESDLARLERGLFDYAVPPKAGFADGSVHIYAAETVYGECEAAAAEICRLLARGMRQRDIAVVTRDLQRYRQTIETVFQKYGLTVFADRRSDAAQKLPIRLLCTALEIAAKGCSLPRMLRLAKTGLAGISLEEANELERYATLWNIGGAIWLSDKGFTAHPAGYGVPFDDNAHAALAHINDLRRRIAIPLARMIASSRHASAAARTQALYAYAEEVGLAAALDARAAAISDPRAKAEYEQLWMLICACFDQCALTLNDVPLTAAEFYELFSMLVTQYHIGTIPTGADCIAVGDASRMRADNPRAVFVLGVCDGVFPPKAPEGGILTQADRKKLADDAGITLSPANEDRVAWEQLIAYQTFAAPSELLWLSYPRSAEPSFLIDRVTTLLPLLIPQQEQYCGAENKTYAAAPCAELAAAAFSENNRDPLAHAARTVLAETQNPILAKAAHAAKTERGSLTVPATVSRLYGAEPVLTASRMEKFRTCRFAHFARYGLKAEPRKKAAFAAAETGTFLHYVLEHTVADIMQNGGWAIDRDTLTQKILASSDRHIADYVEEFLGGLEDKPKRLRYTIERLTQNVREILLSMIDEFAASQFIPVGFEVELGDTKHPFAFDAGGQTVLLSGKVDRIDLWEIGGVKYVRVVDYKSGRKEFSFSDVENGFGIQLLLYLFAKLAEDPTMQPAGVLYKPIGRQRVALKPGMSREKMEAALRKTQRSKGLVLDDDGVILAMEAVGEGKSARFIPVALDGTKIDRRYSSLADRRQFGILKAHISRLLRETRDALVSGSIDCDPFFDSCEFCDYHRICRFDPSNGKDGYREKISVKKPAFFERHAPEAEEVGP